MLTAWGPGVSGPSGLNAKADAAARTVQSIEREVATAKQRVAMAENQQRAVEMKAAQALAPGHPVTRVFQITTPDGRKIEQAAADPEELRRQLLAGYAVTGEVFPAGYVAPVDPLAPTLMDSLLQAHGYSLLQWLDNGSNNNDTDRSFPETRN